MAGFRLEDTLRRTLGVIGVTASLAAIVFVGCTTSSNPDNGTGVPSRGTSSSGGSSGGSSSGSTSSSGGAGSADCSKHVAVSDKPACDVCARASCRNEIDLTSAQIDGGLADGF